MKKLDMLLNNSIYPESICFPRYACNQHLGGILVVAEERISGVALSDCEQLVIEKFLDTYLKNVNKNIPSESNSEADYSVYKLLHNASLRLKKTLPENSSFFKLSLICGEPFQNQKVIGLLVIAMAKSSNKYSS